ncbi:MAG: Asp-tRNA(Asn)/Glu-tRNA(Gln) amidotransferase subunit GatA [Chloroflexi bacterium]|nr:Asp-tRNA(Asn)/Glu-tRNA(Gln) amidotransferase subunit GatA [Chloroflexota bacterium]
MELTDLTLTQAISALRSGETSSRELTRACLARIQRLEPSLHAFLYLAADSALAQANAADRELAVLRKTNSQSPKPLLGIPIAIKDVLTVEGLPCTAGSKILEGFVPPFTATAVKRLQEAGAIVIGKTNTDEFAMGSSTENSAYGVTHNPWDTSRVPGGSSGGSAAAVAARMIPVALGTDTGGSVRQPASFCGVTGLKPTYGRVSRYGLVAYGSSLDCVGALGRTAEDVALLFSIMAGRDALDATTQDVAVPTIDLVGATARVAPGLAVASGRGLAPPLRGLRIGVPREYFVGGIQAEVEASVRQAVSVLEGLGAEVHEISLPHSEYALPVYYIIAPAEASANLARYDGIRYGPRIQAENMWDIFYRTRGRKFGAEVERRIMLGTHALSAGYYDAYYGQAQKVRTLIQRDFEQAFEQVEVIAAPVAPTTAFPIGAHRDDPLAMYLEDVFTLPANLAGVPGLAFPVGLDGAGLPIGMQLMGRHFREDVLLRMAHAYQQVTDWHMRAPSL